MKKIILISLILYPFLIFGQTTLNGSYLNVNNVKAMINPVGNQFSDFTGNYSFKIPADSLTGTFYNSSIWIGGTDANSQLRFAGELNRQNGIDYFPGPLIASGSEMGTTSDSVSQSWNRTWRMSREEIDEFILCYNNPAYPTYQIPTSILEWPANGDLELGQADILAPYFDNNEDGFYNPEDGDHPIIKGDECLFFIFNDNLSLHTETGGNSIGIEVQGMAYEFKCDASESFDNAIFINYKIINRSTNTLFDTYLGLFADFDLGNCTDDYIGCNVQQGSFFAYNGDDFDETANGMYGYGEHPPAQAAVILKGAPLDADGMDNSSSYIENGGVPVLYCDQGDILNGNINGLNYSDGIVDNEILGMNRFVFFHCSGTGANPNTLAPTTAQQYYNYMKGYWLDGTEICYGGTGHYSGGANTDFPARFMFPGYESTTDPCGWGEGGIPQEGWSEETEANPGSDRRGVGVSGPFTFTPNEVVEFEVAYVYARDEDGTSEETLDKLFACVDTVKNGYLNNLTPCGTPFVYNNAQEIAINDNFNLEMFPNPAYSYVNLNFGTSDDFQIDIIDIQGRQNLSLEISGRQASLNISSLSEGVYFIRVSDGENTEIRKLVVLR